jgi:hypothetical protein
MSDRLTVVVEGLDDESIVTEMETAVRQSFDDLALPGPWHVVVRPSEIGGRWDFSVRGLDVRPRLADCRPRPVCCRASALSG